MALARIIRLFKRHKATSKSSDSEPTLEDHQEAELVWIKHAQQYLDLSTCKNLCPVLEEEVYKVGG